jgi:dolichol-phosphate mannosyltransferase
MEKIVIVMPAWNEAENINYMINTLIDEVFPEIDADMQLLVVDNNSTDGMTQIVEGEAKKRKNLHLIQQGNKKGLGNAYVAGLKYAVDKLNANAVMEMDADGQHPPEAVVSMVEAYLQGADYVIGSRYVKGGSVPKEWEFFRKAISFLGNLFIRIVLLQPKIHDLTTGFRLTRVKGVLENINLDSLMEKERFAYKVDLLFRSIKLAGKVTEVPLEFKARKTDRSKFNSKEMKATFKVAVILAIRNKARFIKFGIVGFIGFLVNAIGIEVFRSLPVTTTLAEASHNLEGVPGLSILTTPSSWAAALGAEAAIISNFTLNNLWTFKEKKITNIFGIFTSFLKFNLTSLGAIIIQFFVIGSAVVLFSDTTLVRQLALVVAIVLFIVPYNYTMYNFFIWKTKRLPWVRPDSSEKSPQ